MAGRLTTKAIDNFGPRWMFIIFAFAVWLVLMPLIHGVLPWALSLLTPRYG